MTIQLKPDQENFIKAQVASGRYNSPEEVIAQMFLIFQKVQGDYEQWLQETRQKIDEGIESLDKGEGIDGEVVIDKLRKRLRQVNQGC